MVLLGSFRWKRRPGAGGERERLPRGERASAVAPGRRLRQPAELLVLDVARRRDDDVRAGRRRGGRLERSPGDRAITSAVPITGRPSGWSRTSPPRSGRGRAPGSVLVHGDLLEHDLALVVDSAKRGAKTMSASRRAPSRAGRRGRGVHDGVSREVAALSSPPSRRRSRRSPRGVGRVPLNSRCSMKCETPSLAPPSRPASRRRSRSRTRPSGRPAGAPR